MATAKATEIETPSRPLIQIDDLVREMNEEEFAAYKEIIASAPELPGPAEA
jgi:hypothetical protein